jgi:hypothetical protein
MDKRSIFPCNHFCSHLHVTFFTCRKIWHSASGFTSHPKKGVLRIFIALKNPLPRPGLNLRPLRPVASTLTTTQPRRLHVALEICISNFPHVCYTSRPSYATDLIVHAMHDEWWGQTYEECGETIKTGTTSKICLFKFSSSNWISLQSEAAQCCKIMHLALSREMLLVVFLW